MDNMPDGRPTVAAILLSAGSSQRMGSNKLLFDFGGQTPIELCLRAFEPFVDEAVIAASPSTWDAARAAAEKVSIPVRIVSGGRRRQDSVLNALTASDADIVAVHDCARCLVTGEIIQSSIASAVEFGSGVASVRPVDTLRSEESGETVDRDKLLAAQTPQSFSRELLLAAYDQLGDADCTDDAAVLALSGVKPHYSKGSSLNLKLTTPDDLVLFRAILGARQNEKTVEMQPECCGKGREMFRIGYGEDTHRLVPERKLILGGVEVPFEFGLLGHSDADVLTHALIDAVLGAAALGDIGQHFPDSDMRYKGVNSLLLAKRTAELIAEKGLRIVNLDATIIAQRPKLASYRLTMRENLAEAFGVDAEAVSVKFTTPEMTGPEGRGESITSRAVAMLEKK